VASWLEIFSTAMSSNTTSTVESCKYQHFCGFDSDTKYKIAFMLFAFVGNFFNFFMFCGIIWYERFGTDNKRTLMNKIVSLLCYNGVFYMTVTFFVDFGNYFYGPLSKSICLLIQVFRNLIKSNSLMFLNVLIVTKYVLIFCLKNPTSVNDDFWAFFIGLLTVFFNLLLNFTVLSLPQKHSLFYYACTDIDPKVDEDLGKSKVPGFEVLTCLFLHVLIILRIKIFKAKSGPKVAPSTNTTLPSSSSHVHAKTEIQTLADIASNVCIIIWSVFYLHLQVKVNSLTLAEVNSYPHYLYMFAYHFGCPTVTNFLIALMYYIRHAPLRKKVISEIKEKLISARE
jgi:hypothetical protein